MLRRVSLVCAVAVIMALVSSVRAAQEQAKTPEQQAWEQVDCLNRQSLQDFLKSFPDGQIARQAKAAIELQGKFDDIRQGKSPRPFTFPPGDLGEKWMQWQETSANKGVVGYSVTKGEGANPATVLVSFIPELLTGGKTVCSTLGSGQSGVPACPTGEGSIVAIRTEGLKCELFPGVIFETPGKDPMYFGVVAIAPSRTAGSDAEGPAKPGTTQRRTLVHLKGTGKVTLPDGQTADLEPPKRPDVIYVPTPLPVVDKMLELAQVTKDDVVYDLGCGDARIVVTAAKKYGCKAFGFDIDPQRIKESHENVENNNVGNLVTIEQKDIFTLDLSEANVVTLYLLPSLNVKLIPQLEKLKPGSRIVSHDFDMKGVKPDQVVQVNTNGGGSHTVYFWTTPLKKE